MVIAFFAGWALQFLKAYFMELVYMVERRRARKTQHRDEWVYDI